MAQVLTKPVDPYRAAERPIMIVIVSIILIHVHVLVITIPIERITTPFVMKFVRFEMQSQPHPLFSAQERAKLHST